VHVLQSVPPSNLNRDDTGSPKTAEYGGVRRARVSSQAWKRATRRQFEHDMDRTDLGVRTKRVVEVLAAELVARGHEEDRAAALAGQVLSDAGLKLTKPKKGHHTVPESGYLVFLSRRQIERLADLASSAPGPGTPASKAQARAELKRGNSIDVALFGRMVADATDLNVDAACQVAHAISVHRVVPEFDYFTAVDDAKEQSADEDAGAGMIGTVEFNSSTLYRYATVDVDRLQDNLGDDAAATRAAVAFVRSFATSMHTGKQNTFANRTLPHLVHVVVRADQPVNLVGAFETPLPARAGGYLHAATTALAEHKGLVHEAFGLEPGREWSVVVDGEDDRLGERVSLPVLLQQLGTVVSERLSGQ
jgi:CRISPR system Cascade subunit CasC